MNLLKRIKKNRYVTEFRRYLAYLIALALFRMARHLTWETIVSWGRSLGRFAFRRVKYGRKLTLNNLTRVFGDEMTEEEIERIAERVYENMGVTALEFPRMPSMTDREFFEVVDYDPEDEALLRELLEQGKGSVYAGAHMGNWEMLADLGARLGLTMSVLYKPSTNPYLNRLWSRMRGRNKLIDINKNLALVTRRLKENEGICLLFDENARSRGIKLPFFGRPASMYKGPAFFALRTGAPIVCVYFIRQEDFRHRFIIERVIWPKRTGNLEEDIITILMELNESLETMIRKYPDQWNWIYKRWS
ncbi:MAG: lysophospholipid acyltransferase family protein [PVC group bacterium]